MADAQKRKKKKESETAYLEWLKSWVWFRLMKHETGKNWLKRSIYLEVVKEK